MLQVLRWPSEVKAIISDVDDSHYHSEEYNQHHRITEYELVAEVQQISTSKARELVIQTTVDLSQADGHKARPREVLFHLGITPEQLLETRKKWQPERFLEPNPFHVRNMNRLLAFGIRFVCISMSPTEITRRVMQSVGLGHICPLSDIFGAEFGSKPDPQVFLRALAAAGVPAENCLAVGDDRQLDCDTPLWMGMGAVVLKRTDPFAGWQYIADQLTATQ